MGFFTKLKKIFSGKEEESVSSEEEKKEAEVQEGEGRSSSQDEEAESSGQEKNEALVQQSAGREGESSSGKSEEPSCHGGSADRDESGEGYAAHGMPEEAAPSAQQISESGVPSGKEAPSAAAEPEKAAEQPVQSAGAAAPSPASAEEEELTVRLRACEPRLSVWLDTVLDGVTEAGPLLEKRIRFLLSSLEAPAAEIDSFVSDFSGWLERMEYRNLDEFRSELQYRLALALDLEDEEDERSRLFIKLSDGLAKTREQFSRRLEGLFASNGELNDEFWEQMEEIFIMADLGYEASEELVSRLRERCRQEKVTSSQGVREVLRQEIKSIFAQPRRISAVNPPEIVLMIGVNGAGKTTTIAKLAYRDRMQGKKVMIAAADTFRAAAIDQLRVWSERVGTLFHAKQPGADPASVAYEAVDRAIKEGVDVLYVDTAGRLQTKVNLMDELTKIRQVIGKKHPGAPHRTVLVLDATTGQNALSQAKLFKESAGVDELILTKLDGTAKGGVAIAVAMQYKLPITFIGLGEKVEDLRPFNGDDYADALLASV
ncbi:MAG: signal recognition particle-docking protein FtsY [Desulfovibrio sp.]|jgi:fused signal recognition particle receptor|nr:signal recognition particle-docking protein FtsY [Desulfovibrio sp.]